MKLKFTHGFALAILLLSLPIRAALSDRLQIEENVRNRLQDFLSAYDNQSKVTVKFDYKVYQDTLPGTHLDSGQGVMPSKIESSDIRFITVDIYSAQLTQLPNEVESSILQLLPVRKNAVTINIKKLASSNQFNFKNQVNIQNLDNIAEKWFSQFSHVVYQSFALFALLFSSLFAFLYIRRDKLIHSQMTSLTKALTESQSSGKEEGFGFEEKHFSQEPFQNSEDPQLDPESTKLPSVALIEVFADCYWCEYDANSHWLWKQISFEQKANLLKDLPFMKEYSNFFTQVSAEVFDLHKHPFYLQPVSCKHLSANDLLTQVKKDLSRWHQLSPIRQASIQLSLKEKIIAIGSPVKLNFAWENISASQPRSLKQVIAPIYLTLQEESEVLNNPKQVPEYLRNSMYSLCWLAMLPKDQLAKTLERFDARTLAEGWIGSENVLLKLQSVLPEKKVKALNSFKTRIVANKKSQAYLTLVQLGQKILQQNEGQISAKNEAA